MNWTEKQTTPANRVDRGHKLKTPDFETNLCKGNCVGIQTNLCKGFCVGIRTGNFFVWFSMDCGTKMNKTILGVRCESNCTTKSYDYHVMGMRVHDLHQVEVTINLQTYTRSEF
jgi:hypothetical protein